MKTVKPLLMGAGEEYTLQVVPFLLDRGADLGSKDNNGRTPLGAAVENVEIRSSASLSPERSRGLEARDNNTHTSSMLAVRFHNVEMMGFRLRRGADPQAVSPLPNQTHTFLKELIVEKNAATPSIRIPGAKTSVFSPLPAPRFSFPIPAHQPVSDSTTLKH